MGTEDRVRRLAAMCHGRRAMAGKPGNDMQQQEHSSVPNNTVLAASRRFLSFLDSALASPVFQLQVPANNNYFNWFFFSMTPAAKPAVLLQIAGCDRSRSGTRTSCRGRRVS